MLRCPHCQSNGLRVVEKVLSSAGGPARCQRCGGLSYSNDSFTFLVSALSQLLLVGAVVIALYYHAWWPFVALGALVLTAPFIALALPATVTSANQAKRARMLQVFALALLVIAVFAASILT
ncbi:MAG: hypothetical protein K2X00_17225 [Nitrospiraceae bacterium]|jgi:hypothetical protein|nr:hypothetical protein [Nitrospiraceae bacterium]